MAKIFKCNKKTIESFINSSHDATYHFISTDKMINLAKDTVGKKHDYKLSRYACQLIVQKGKACDTHYEVGRKVRNAIEDIGGTMPENLPTPNKSIKQIKKDSTKIITGGSNELL